MVLAPRGLASVSLLFAFLALAAVCALGLALAFIHHLHVIYSLLWLESGFQHTSL